MRDPKSVGLPFQTSLRTARRLASVALQAVTLGESIVELGAGTGNVCHALMEAGCAAHRLIAIERDVRLCNIMERRLPGVSVIQGDALNLEALLLRRRLPPIGAIVNGLPMRALTQAAAIHCYSQAFKLMRSAGSLIQYTYGFRPPVEPCQVRPNLQALFLGREWRNAPPVGIWLYREPL
jgi:phosphatidylethanolamine/phosphatidyl-N-methylethanolamine N-methyltransferase